MKYLFTWYVMIPAIIIFSFCNGIYFHSVSNDLLYIGTAIIGFGSAVISVFYGAFVQGSGTMFTKGAKWFGLIVYALFFGGSISGLVSTYGNTSTLHHQTIENLRYLFSNFIVAFGYGAAGLIWSFCTITLSGPLRRLPSSRQGKLAQIEN